MTQARALSLNPALRTPRLQLEPLLGAHAPMLYPLLADPRGHVWISGPSSPSVEALQERWSRQEARLDPTGSEASLAWAVVRVDTGVPIAKVDACVDDTGVATNVGYALQPEHWGFGYITEAVGAVVEHLVRAGVHELRATVTVGNERSYRVLERLGFVREGVLVGNDVIRGVAHDDLLFVRRVVAGR